VKLRTNAGYQMFKKWQESQASAPVHQPQAPAPQAPVQQPPMQQPPAQAPMAPPQEPFAGQDEFGF